MTSASKKKVLTIGFSLAPDLNPDKGIWSPDRIAEAMKHQIQLADQAGFNLTSCQVDSSKSEDENVDKVRAALKSEHWDGVSIGFGVRGVEAYTPLFERLVNAVVEDVHPTPKFIFAVRPSSVWEAVSRAFGIDSSK